MEGLANIAYSDAHRALLAEFAAASEKQLSPQLEKIVHDISLVGVTCYPWDHLKQLLAYKLSLVLDDHNCRTPEMRFEEKRNTLLKQLQSFVDPPFTVQRLCELLVNPGLYSNTHKYLFAVDKVLLVTSTQQTLSPEAYDAQVQTLLANMGAIYASNKSDAELNRTKSESEESAFPQTQPDSSLGAALDSFTPTTVQVPILDASGASTTTTFTSGSPADSMDVVDDRSQATAGVTSAAESTTHQQFSSLASDASAMDVDNQKIDGDAMDVDKPAQ
eukprot:TRINITY_DN8828_c0_g1_i1.p1 TRINITY_DN8828_c0_g1~~TRINITY_DN8828_c0_g1_i1.p1  ORF type:complete len:275 (-),score=59.79 TRINITY_DN8828_c0_g1_i1:73-897(-)